MFLHDSPDPLAAYRARLGRHPINVFAQGGQGGNQGGAKQALFDTAEVRIICPIDHHNKDASVPFEKQTVNAATHICECLSEPPSQHLRGNKQVFRRHKPPGLDHFGTDESDDRVRESAVGRPFRIL